MSDEHKTISPEVGQPSGQMPTFIGFRGRPYTKAVPSTQALTGVAGGNLTLWSPGQAFFELALILAKSSLAGDFAICDSATANIIGYMQFDGVNYSRLDLGQAGLRSQSAIGAKLLLLDPVGVAATIKAVCYGWEVTRDGNYR